MAHKKHEEHKEEHAEHHEKHEGHANGGKEGKWMLPASFVLAFLFFIPLASLIGAILAVFSFGKAKNKVVPALALILNLLLGYFLNWPFTEALLQVFVFS